MSFCEYVIDVVASVDFMWERFVMHQKSIESWFLHFLFRWPLLMGKIALKQISIYFVIGNDKLNLGLENWSRESCNRKKSLPYFFSFRRSYPCFAPDSMSLASSFSISFFLQLFQYNNLRTNFRKLKIATTNFKHPHHLDMKQRRYLLVVKKIFSATFFHWTLFHL